MRVKAGDTWYDEKDLPICIQLSDKDLELIKGMTRDTSPKLKYAVWHESAAFETTDQVKEWMNS